MPQYLVGVSLITCLIDLLLFSVFTNVAETGDGGVYWEGMGEEPVQPVTSWLNEPWTKGNETDFCLT